MCLSYTEDCQCDEHLQNQERYLPIELTSEQALSILRGMLYKLTGEQYELRCDGSTLLVHHAKRMCVKQLIDERYLSALIGFTALVPFKSIFLQGYGAIPVSAGLAELRSHAARANPSPLRS